jgi:hypothetical protein
MNTQVTKYSVGKNLTANVANTLLTVPTGYRAIVSYLFIANAATSGSASVSASWVNGTTIVFQSAKSVGHGEALQFGGDGKWMALREGDSIVVTPDAGSTFTTIISFELERHNPAAVSFT